MLEWESDNMSDNVDKTEKKVKKGRPVRNKARDVLGDYWVTNREYHIDNARRAEEERQSREETSGGKRKREPFKTNEKVYIGIIILCLVLIVVKYFL